MLRLAGALAAAAVLAYGGYGLSTRAASQSSSTLTVASASGYMKGYETLSWAPSALATGFVLYRDGVQVSTAGPAATSTRFFLQAGTHTISAVAVLGQPPSTTTAPPTTTTVPTTTSVPPPAASVWRWDASAAAVAPNSAAAVASFQSYAVAAGTYFQAAVAWAKAPAGTASYSIPVTGQSVGSITAPVPLGTKPGSTFDQSLYVIGADGTEYDFGLAQYDSSTGKIKSTDGAAPVPAGAAFETGPGSGNAARFPLAAGPVTPADVKSGVIDHPLAITMPNVGPCPCPFPANTIYGYPSNTGVPLGSWLRLDPSVNVGSLGLPPLEAMIAKAMQRYGMFVRDIGSTLSVIGTDQVNQGGNASDWPAAGVTLEAKTPAGVPYAHGLSSKFPWPKLQLLNPPSPTTPSTPSTTTSTPTPAPSSAAYDVTITPNWLSSQDPASSNYQAVWVYPASPSTPYRSPDSSRHVQRYLLLDPRYTDADGRKGNDDWWFVMQRNWPSSYPASNHGAWGREENFHNVAGDAGPAGSGGVGWSFGDGVSALALDWLPANAAPSIGVEPAGLNLPLPTPTRDAWHTYVLHWVAGRTDGTTVQQGSLEVWADGVKVVDQHGINTVQRAKGPDGVFYVQRWMQLWEGDYTRALPVVSTYRLALTRIGRSLAEALADQPTVDSTNEATEFYNGQGSNFGAPSVKAAGTSGLLVTPR